MRAFFIAVLVIFLQNLSSPAPELPDLACMLDNDGALDQLRVAYWPPTKKGWSQAFFVRGDGSVILQASPDRPMPVTDIPTCTGQIDRDRVRALLRLIIQNHFVELPERNFIFMDAAQGNKHLELHTIGIMDGHAKARRSFGIGKYAGKDEVIPPEFAIIEQDLKKIWDSTFPPHAKDCRFSAPIKF